MRDVIIIGAGQAGLGLSYCLTQQGVDHVILEKGDIGRAWREDRWDSFCRVTPNWTITLPGAEYAGEDPGGFMDRDDFVRHLEAWAKSFDAPIQTHTEVLSVAKTDAGFKLETSTGPLEAQCVVLACATYQQPRVPGFAAALDPGIQQVHAAGYRSPAALPPGGMLVVGSGQSGCQIADELNRAGRKTVLAVGDTGRLPRRYRGRDCIDWQNDIGLLDRTPDMLDSPAHRFRGDPHLSGARGGHTLSLHILQADGVTLLGRIEDVHGGKTLALKDTLVASMASADAFAQNFFKMVDAYIAENDITAPPPAPSDFDGEPPPNAVVNNGPAEYDLAAEGITTVIWATGFQYDFSWVKPLPLDQFGYPETTSDGATAVPGLYCMGLNWAPKRKSGIIYGVAEDAKRLAQQLAKSR